MKHSLFERHVWKLKSKETIKSLVTLAVEKGMKITVQGFGLEKDRVIYIFECAICGSEKTEVLQ